MIEPTILLVQLLEDIENHCPCGARPESPRTHPHVGGCPVPKALSLARTMRTLSVDHVNATPLKFSLDFRGEFDEVWMANCFVHIERMNATGYWIGFDLPDGRSVMLNTGVAEGTWFFRIEEDLLHGQRFYVSRPRSSRAFEAGIKLRPENGKRPGDSGELIEGAASPPTVEVPATKGKKTTTVELGDKQWGMVSMAVQRDLNMARNELRDLDGRFSTWRPALKKRIADLARVKQQILVQRRKGK